MTAATRSETTLHIDWTRCDGHGLCAVLLAGRIGRDEWGYPVLSGGGHTVVAAEDLKDARRAALACPALALRIEP